MKKELSEYWADLKKALTPKMFVFLAIGIVAFLIHPLLGLVFAGVAMNFLMSFYTSKGVLNRDSSEDTNSVQREACDASETEKDIWNL